MAVELPGLSPSLPVARASTAVPSAPVGQVGAALERGGAQLFNTATAMQREYQREQERINQYRAEDAFNQLRQRQLELTVGENEGFTYVKGGDAIKSPLLKDYSAKLDDSISAISQALGNDDQRRAFALRADVVRNQMSEDILQHLQRENGIYQKSVMSSTLDVERRNASQRWSNPAEVEASLARTQAAVKTYAQSQGISGEPLDAMLVDAVSNMHATVIEEALVNENPQYAKAYFEAHRKNFTAEQAIAAQQSIKTALVSEDSAAIRFDMMEDPDQAILNLVQNQYKNLGPEHKAIWLERANAAAEELARRRLREHTLLEDKTEKAGIALLMNNELTEQWIDEQQDNLDPAAYKYLYTQLNDPDAVTTNKTAYSLLRQQASDGQDVRTEARGLLLAGEIKLSDYNTLVSRSEDNVGISSVPNDFKRGEKFISNSLRVSDLNPDPAAAQRLASALDDWTQWTTDHKEADGEQARKAYTRIVREYQLIDYGNITLTKRLPRFAVGDRQSLNLEATQQATLRALDNQEITEEEFNRQAQLLEEWEAAMHVLKPTTAGSQRGE